MFARQYLELTLANYVHSQCAKRCRPEFTQDRSMTLKLIDSKLEITGKEILRTLLCLFIKN